MSEDKLDKPSKLYWREGLDVHHLIFQTEDLIVFIDSDLDVDWETSEKYDKEEKGDNEKHNEILNRAAIIECIPNDHHQKSTRLNFKRMIGEGVARSLEQDYDNAAKILEKAENYITNRNIEVARIWQLLTSTLIGITCLIVGLFFWSWRSLFFSLWGKTVFFIVLSGFAGAVGANLSLFFRIGKTKITSEAVRKLHILEAASRIFGGAISGVVIAFLVLLGVIIPIFQNIDKTHIAMVAAGLLAGASERWAPSIISKFENSSIEEKEKK